jgi:hypothetical protein
MTVTLTPEEFHALARRVLEVELLTLRAKVSIDEALAKRAACYAAIAAAHDLPATFATFSLNDETSELTITAG